MRRGAAHNVGHAQSMTLAPTAVQMLGFGQYMSPLAWRSMLVPGIRWGTALAPLTSANVLITRSGALRAGCSGKQAHAGHHTGSDCGASPSVRADWAARARSVKRALCWHAMGTMLAPANVRTCQVRWSFLA